MSENEDFSEKALKIINKEYGNVSKSAKSFMEKKNIIVPVSPSTDIALNGGVPEGSWLVYNGKPKCGKTTSALHFAKNCQKKEYGSKHIYFMNIEGRLKEMNLDGIEGLEKEKFTIIESEEERILSAKDYLNIAEKLVYSHPGCVILFDSFSALCHEKELQDGVGTSTRGGGAALLAQFCRQMANVVPVKKTIIIGITHLMANTSGYGAAMQEKGGLGIAYQVDVKLRCKSTEPWDHNGKRVGQKVTWVAETTALGGVPGSEFESWIRYGKGIDELKEIIVIGQDIGLIEKKGAYYYGTFMQNYLPVLGLTQWDDNAIKMTRSQGEDNFYNLLKDNPKWVNCLEKDISSILGLKR